ncbi:MAG: hypothetical protein WCI97_10575 [Bacteroidota bacterium]
MENQILDENVSQSTEISFDERVRNVLANGYSFEIGKYLSTGSAILNKNLGGFIAYLFVVIAINIGCSMIPVIGSIANSFFISPALYAGFVIMSFRVFKEKNTEFGKFFGGFKFVAPLALLTVLTIIIFAIVVIPYILIALGSQFSQIIDLVKNVQSGDEDPVLVAQFILTFVYKLIPLFFICLIVSVCFSFSQYIVVFGKKGAMDALSISAKIIWKRFISMLLFLIVIGLINILGAICLLVGLLYTIPLSMCAMYAAYEHIVGTSSSDIED